MAISLITVYPVDTRSEDETLRQLATAVVATEFNDYMMGQLHPEYVAQVATARHCLKSYLNGEGQQYLDKALELMDGCFFRRVQWYRKDIINDCDEGTIRWVILKMNKIVEEETRRTDYQRHYESAVRFLFSPLFDLYTSGMVDLETALRHCDEEIEKEKARIR